MFEKLRREVKFNAGYNCIKFDCRFDKKCSIENTHGKHGVEILFYVHGKKGAIQFGLSTGWFPQYVIPDKIRYRDLDNGFRNQLNCYPMAFDLGYHSYVPHYEGQKPISNKCKVIGGVCYYDGSSLNANDALYTLINGGDEKLWEFLEKYYLYIFEKGKYPKVAEYPTKIRKI